MLLISWQLSSVPIICNLDYDVNSRDQTAFYVHRTYYETPRECRDWHSPPFASGRMLLHTADTILWHLHSHTHARVFCASKRPCSHTRAGINYMACELSAMVLFRVRPKTPAAKLKLVYCAGAGFVWALCFFCEFRQPKKNTCNRALARFFPYLSAKPLFRHIFSRALLHALT